MNWIYINKIPYKYILNSDFDYSNEELWSLFENNREEVFNEFIDYSNEDDVEFLQRELDDLITKIDRVGLERLDLIIMMMNRLSDKFGIGPGPVDHSKAPNFYSWKATIQQILGFNIDDNVSIAEAIELEKIAIRLNERV